LIKLSSSNTVTHSKFIRILYNDDDNDNDIIGCVMTTMMISLGNAMNVLNITIHKNK